MISDTGKRSLFPDPLSGPKCRLFFSLLMQGMFSTLRTILFEFDFSFHFFLVATVIDKPFADGTF